MRVRDIYAEAIKFKYYSLRLLIEYLVFERKVLKLEDDERKIYYYLQKRFAKKMNQYLREYEAKRYGRKIS